MEKEVIEDTCIECQSEKEDMDRDPYLCNECLDVYLNGEDEEVR
jgi:hypothetical protein